MNTKFYGLTGGIGSGKSTVATIFADLGVPTLDLDKVGRTLLNQPQIQHQLVAAFGESILHNQNINRRILREVAFISETNTQQLNHIMHPAIRQAEMLWRKEQTAPFAVIEASVLIESNDVARMRGLIVVLTDLDIRKQRVLKRGKQDEASFHAIDKQQCSDEERKQAADYILYNNRDTQALRSQVNELHQVLT